MKRLMPRFLIFSSIALIVIGLIFIYVFFPGGISFNQQVIIHGNVTNASRFLSEEGNWREWWPRNEHGKALPAGIHNYHSYKYSINWKLLTGDSIKIENNNITINSLLNIIPLEGDSVKIQWNGHSAESLNPLKRIKNYSEQATVKKNTYDILESMKLFLENKDALYGIHIDQIMVKDTILIARKLKSDTYPATNDIYLAINEVKEYIRKEGAIETNYPMLHIAEDNGVYETMIAIPVSKLLPADNKFLLKRMIPGKILITEVRGGKFTADMALKKIENYMEDYKLLSPALPFQSLVTDRSKEPDTSKWLTKIYYPVM